MRQRIQVKYAFLLILPFVVGAYGCKRESAGHHAETTETAPVSIPPFSRDSAYHFVEQQLSFGPRNPGSDGMLACRKWLIEKFEAYHADVIQQDFQAHFADGSVVPSVNIIAQYNPENRTRILLAAHYDTRAIAEEDADPATRDKPIMGADDGASGVAILLEIARLLQAHSIGLGVDLILFDAEDQGLRDDDSDNSSWCIGSQYWSKNVHVANYRPRFGILLDMVGAKNAFFNKENVTGLYKQAKEVHNLYTKVWNLAAAMGKGRYFQDRAISGIIDDHYFVNKNTGIPMIDIINKPPGDQHGFGDHWHTHKDDIGVIDRNTLAAVGQVITAVTYRSDAGTF